MQATWNSAARDRVLTIDGHTVGRLLPLDHPDLDVQDELAAAGDGTFRILRRCTLRRDAPARPVRITLDFAAAHRAAFWMIPAISYNGNPWGSGQEPKGAARDGRPWTFAAHRAAVAGATYSEGPAWTVALLAATPVPDCGLACALLPERDRTIHRLIWPEEEQPAVYCERDKYAPGCAATLALHPGQTFTAAAWLIVAPATPPRPLYRTFLDRAWSLTRRPPPTPRYSPQQVWDLGRHYATDIVWAEEGVFRGFSIGLVWDGQRWLQRPTRKYEIGWAGQNASLACSLLHDALRTGDPAVRDKGLATLDTWLHHGRFRSGLVYAIIDPLVGLPRKDIHDACNLGNAAADFLEAWELARRAGIDRPGYRDLALGICDCLRARQRPDGRYGRAWARDGTCLATEGTIGAFLIPAMLAAHRATGAAEYLASAERAFDLYAGELLRDGFTTAGALDSDCIDKESAWPLIDAGLALHALTGRAEYLEAAEAASYYTATWQYLHSVPVPPGGMLADMGYDSFGGTAVSTQHHHIDPYAVRCVPAWLRLAELTGNALWAERARAAWCNGLLGLSDGTLTLRGVRLPRGTQCEGYFQTRWLDRGNSSLLLVAWPTAFRLEALRRLSDWSPLA